MNHHRAVLWILLVLGAAAVATATAQEGLRRRGSGGWGPESAYHRLFNAAAVGTVRGEVVRVERTEPLRGMAVGIQLVLRTVEGDIRVHLGPSWYLEYQDLKVVPNDRVIVRGSRTRVAERPVIIAVEVVRQEDILRLRDDEGYPFWTAWRKR